MRRARTGFRLVLVSIIVAVVASGCVSEADPDDLTAVLERSGERGREDDALRAAIDQGLELGGGGITSHLSSDERECSETGMRDTGIDFRTALTDPAAGDDRVRVIEVVLECLEEPVTNEGLIETIRRSVEVSMGDTVELSDGEVSCYLEHVLMHSDHPARTLVTGDGPDDLDLTLEAFELCLTPDNYDTVMGAEGTGPQAYGDDPRFDAVHDDCDDGDPRACDLLFMMSSIGSDYETFAVTCGGTKPADDLFCAPESETDDSGAAPADSPGLPILADDCEDGDLTACDLLYYLAPFQSDYELIGHTCGGRIAIGALPDCRTRLG